MAGNRTVFVLGMGGGLKSKAGACSLFFADFKNEIFFFLDCLKAPWELSGSRGNLFLCFRKGFSFSVEASSHEELGNLGKALKMEDGRVLPGLAAPRTCSQLVN